MIIVEMVDSLGMFESYKVDITYSGGPLEVIVRRPDVLVLCPPSIKQRFS
jgi:hypothetical protein